MSSTAPQGFRRTVMLKSSLAERSSRDPALTSRPANRGKSDYSPLYNPAARFSTEGSCHLFLATSGMKVSSSRFRIALLIGALALVAVPGSLSAQQEVGALYGSVTDPEGITLPGATLTLTGLASLPLWLPLTFTSY